jgi:hypothetical protein
MRLSRALTVATTVATLCGCGSETSTPPSSAPSVAASPQVAPSPAISDMALNVTLDIRAPDYDPNALDSYLGSPSSLHLGTVVVLEDPEGGDMKLIDDVRAGPIVSKASDGSYVFVFHYTPEYGGALTQHSVQELRRVTALGIRFAGVLKALNVPVDSAEVTRLEISVNGGSAASLDLKQPIADDGANMQSIAIGSLTASAANS